MGGKCSSLRDGSLLTGGTVARTTPWEIRVPMRGPCDGGLRTWSGPNRSSHKQSSLCAVGLSSASEPASGPSASWLTRPPPTRSSPDATGRSDSTSSSARSTWPAASPGPSRRAGSATPTCSPGPGAWARRARRGSSRRRSSVPRGRRVSRATRATPAGTSRRDRTSTSWRSTRRAIGASTRSASCGRTSPSVRPGAASRSTSSTKCTCSRARPSTRCSRRSKSLPGT